MKNSNETLLMASIAKFVLGESSGIKISSKDKDKIQATLDAAKATKNLYEALSKSDSSLLNVMPLVEKKNEMTSRFEEVTGIDWRL